MSNLFQKKTIIIHIPDDFGLPEMFKKNLEQLDFHVISLDHLKKEEKISTLDYSIHVWKKVINNDKTYKSETKEKNRLLKEKKIQLELLRSIKDKTDFALIIRPDLLDTEVIKAIKSSTHKMIGYQWDGLERYPKIFSKIDFFDHFFVFDERDLCYNPKLKTTTNFYFDYDIEENSDIDSDVFFIGSFINNRMKALFEISEHLKNKGLQLNINVVGCNRKYIELNNHKGVNFLTNILNFKENYNAIKKTKAILDLLNDIHNGLSLRTFEAIGFQKKLITNNPLVKNYDFYLPENIFILGERNIDELEQFLETPYQKLENEIYEKYSFSFWLKNILYN